MKLQQKKSRWSEERIDDQIQVKTIYDASQMIFRTFSPKTISKYTDVLSQHPWAPFEDFQPALMFTSAGRNYENALKL